LFGIIGNSSAITAAPSEWQMEVPSLGELVDRFDRAQAGAETLRTQFTLSIKRAMLQTPSVTKGTLYLYGSECAHFDFAPPEDLVIHITSKALVSYSPMEKIGEMQKIRLKKNVNRKFLGLGQRLSYLSDYFKLDAPQPDQGALLVTLKPRSLSLKKRMELVQIWIDKDTYLPKKLKWVERGGDAWLLEMGTIQTNVAIPPSVINFAMPPGTPAKHGFSFFAARKK
jgi:outer membrane lipoprotein-sorting protein